MERGNYYGHSFYGELMEIKKALSEVEDGLDCILCNNGIQGEEAVEFLEKLLPIIHEGVIEHQDDYGDTVIFRVKSDCYKELVKLVAKYKPDEFTEGDEDVWRMWWD